MSGPFDLSIGDIGLPDMSTLMRGISSDYGTDDVSSILHANIPDFTVSTQDLLSTSSYLPSNVPPAGSYNAVTGVSPTPATGSSFSYADAQQAANLLAQLARTGTAAYATVSQIDAGNAAPYAFQNPGAAPVDYTPPVDESALPTIPAAPFTLASLYDFKTPYPYMIGGGLLLLVLVATGGKKSGRR